MPREPRRRTRPRAAHRHRRSRTGDPAETAAGPERRRRGRSPRLPGGDHVLGVGPRPRQGERRDLLERVRRERERRDHADVAAARAPERPEEVRLRRSIASHDAPIGKHDRRRPERVAGQAEPAADHSLTAAERQPTDPNGRARPDRDHRADGREPRRDVDHPRTRTDRRGSWRCSNPRQLGDVDHDPVRERVPAVAVSAASRAERQVVVAGEQDRPRDVAGRRRDHDRTWTHVVEPRVVAQACDRIARGARPDQPAVQTGGELIPGWRRRRAARGRGRRSGCWRGRRARGSRACRRQRGERRAREHQPAGSPEESSAIHARMVGDGPLSDARPRRCLTPRPANHDPGS